MNYFKNNINETLLDRMARVSALIGAETGQVYSSEEMLAAVTQQFNKFTMCINCSTEYKTNSFTCQKWGESVEGCLYGTGSLFSL